VLWIAAAFEPLACRTVDATIAENDEGAFAFFFRLFVCPICEVATKAVAIAITGIK